MLERDRQGRSPRRAGGQCRRRREISAESSQRSVGSRRAARESAPGSIANANCTRSRTRQRTRPLAARRLPVLEQIRLVLAVVARGHALEIFLDEDLELAAVG